MLFAERVELKTLIDSPVFLTIVRRKYHKGISHKLFRAKTSYKLADANRCVHFDSEFCIKSKLQKKGAGFGKKFVVIKLHLVNARKGHKEALCKWKFDAANLPKPDSVEVRESVVKCIESFGEARLFFRLVTVPVAAFPYGPPLHFFAFVTSKSNEPAVLEVPEPNGLSDMSDLDEDPGEGEICVVETKATRDDSDDEVSPRGTPVRARERQRDLAMRASSPVAELKQAEATPKTEAERGGDDGVGKERTEIQAATPGETAPKLDVDKSNVQDEKATAQKHSDDKKSDAEKETEPKAETDKPKPAVTIEEKAETDKPKPAVTIEEKEDTDLHEEGKGRTIEENLRESASVGGKIRLERMRSREKLVAEQKRASVRADRDLKLFLGGETDIHIADAHPEEDEVSKELEEKRAIAEKTGKEFDVLYRQNQDDLADLVTYQCMIHFVTAVMNALVAPENTKKDRSSILMEPIKAFRIFEIPGLTTNHVNYLCEPLLKGLQQTLTRTHTIPSLFAILATALNFGQQLSDVATVYTSAHGSVLASLEPYVTSIVHLATQTLVASIAPSICNDGFQFADDEAMENIREETHLFLECARGLKLPEQLVQVVIVETCAYFDALLFNVIIDTCEEITDDKMVFLLQRIRKIQSLFDCLPNNFQAAFPHLLDLIARTQALRCIGDALPQTARGDLARSIIERSSPPILLPDGLCLDDVGNHLKSRISLRVPLPQVSFKFTFEWLYTQTATEKWD